ncbi:uracil-DNA glycosylase family protein [Teichococcus aestuarii]|uniref:uracil-DNA glycosylase family protein n=1 Tax=Teichococcus aestuarii TaxID=568898 RepID=UPI0026855FCA
MGETARVLIISQAPSSRVHVTGLPWNDASGERLRGWMGIDRPTFDDGARVAIVPMGLCYPGRLPRGGDAPPRPECAPLWHPRLIPPMRQVRLTLLVGAHAVRAVLGRAAASRFGETVRDQAALRPRGLAVLPHPSWRTKVWADARPWFEQAVLPGLREAVARALAG